MKKGNAVSKKRGITTSAAVPKNNPESGEKAVHRIWARHKASLNAPSLIDIMTDEYLKLQRTVHYWIIRLASADYYRKSPHTRWGTLPKSIALLLR